MASDGRSRLWKQASDMFRLNVQGPIIINKLEGNCRQVRAETRQGHWGWGRRLRKTGVKCRGVVRR